MHKILVIDDEEANVRLLSMSLKSDGYDVAVAYSGKEGVEVFKKENPAIVITDIKMPGMDGLEVLKEIKKTEPDTQVIIVTGHGDIDSAIEALQYGASDFINKPIKDEALAIALRRASEKIATNKKLKEHTCDLETMVEIASQEFRRKSNFHAKLIKSSNDAIIATDDDFEVVIFNPEAEKVLGYPRSEVISKIHIKQLCPEAVENISDDKKEKRESVWREINVRSKDGEEIPVRFSRTVLREKGKIMGVVAFFHDLREIKRLERELLNSERLAAIGQTVAGMAHCIKNILHGFKGGSYLVDLGLDKDDTGKLKTGWDMIQRSIKRTSDLVLDLLSYSKGREPEYQECDPNEIAAEVCELVKENAHEHDISIETDFSPQINKVVIDPKITYRALLNLASNAIDACLYDEEFEKQHIVSVKTALDENFVKFEVRDNGSGMPNDVEQKLFSSFFSTKGSKGTGLGLLVTKKLVEEHNGTIEFESEWGKGTAFIFRLPVGKS